MSILAENLQTCNNFSSCPTNGSIHPNNSLSIRRIPNLAFKLLKLLYDDHMANAESDRSLAELMARFKRSRSAIERAIAFLHSLNFIETLKRGQDFALRWITLCGFSWLENQSPHQTLHQNSSIPNIYLSKKEEIEISKTLKKEEICGKEDFKVLEMDVDEFFKAKHVKYSDREQIKMALNRSQLPQSVTNKMIGRIYYSISNKPIQSIKSYLLSCIQNEMKNISFWKDKFKSVGLI